MEPYRLRVPASVDELVRTLHPDLKQKIRAGLDLIRNDSTSGKPLQDELASLRSLRVGRFRIIYRKIVAIQFVHQKLAFTEQLLPDLFCFCFSHYDMENVLLSCTLYIIAPTRLHEPSRASK